MLVRLEIASYFPHGQSYPSGVGGRRGSGWSIFASVAVSSKARKFGQAPDEAFHLPVAVLPVLPEEKRAPVPVARDQSLQHPLRHFSVSAVLRNESQPRGGICVLAE